MLAVLATVAATAEWIATEIRALQKTDTLEAEEPFAARARRVPRRCRTSATRSPPSASCGLARVVKANAQVGFDNVALWHERDISHSSAERVVLADSFIATDYLLGKLEWILDGLVVYPERMLANLETTRGLIYSSRVLLALVDTGMLARGRVRDRAAQRDGGVGRHPAGARGPDATASCSRPIPSARCCPPSSSTRSSTRGRSSRASAWCSSG